MLKVAERRRLTGLVQQTLKERPEVRPFPQAVAQLLAACQDSSSTPASFEKIIQTDPALSVRLLRMANSPIYGLTAEVRTISHAVAILGMRQLRHLALSAAGAKMFSQGNTSGGERERLWNHSLTAAVTARLLARRTGKADQDEAYLAGIFHDVGKLFLFDVVPEEYAELTASVPREQVIEEEKFVFGVSHEEIGLKSAHSWALAETLKAAIGYHHNPQESPIHVEFVELIADANQLAHGWARQSETQAEDETVRAITERLGYLPDQAQQLADDVQTQLIQIGQAMAG